MFLFSFGFFLFVLFVVIVTPSYNSITTTWWIHDGTSKRMCCRQKLSSNLICMPKWLWMSVFFVVNFKWIFDVFHCALQSWGETHTSISSSGQQITPNFITNLGNLSHQLSGKSEVCWERERELLCFSHWFGLFTSAAKFETKKNHHPAESENSVTERDNGFCL